MSLTSMPPTVLCKCSFSDWFLFCLSAFVLPSSAPLYSHVHRQHHLLLASLSFFFSSLLSPFNAALFLSNVAGLSFPTPPHLFLLRHTDPRPGRLSSGVSLRALHSKPPPLLRSQNRTWLPSSPPCFYGNDERSDEAGMFWRDG